MASLNHQAQDFYRILGVTPGVSSEDLRKSYLKLALIYHPDKNPGDVVAEERFKNISQAYAVLSNPEARARYDRLSRFGFGPGSSKGSSQNDSKYAQGKAQSAQNRTQRTGHQNQRQYEPKSETGSMGSQKKEESADRSKGAFSEGEPKQDKKQGANGQSFEREAGGSKTGDKNFAKGPKSDGKHYNEPDLEDILDNFFKSEEGQASFRKLEQELAKAGMTFKFDSLMRQIQWAMNKPSAGASVKKFCSQIFSGIKRIILKNPLEPLEIISPWDICYNLALSPLAAQNGTIIEISYLRDGQYQNLSVSVPAGSKDGARLRLSGQGHLKADKSRGDLILTISIHFAA